MDGCNNAFCSSKEEYEIARLTTKCAGLQGKIESQAAEIAELDALRNDAVLRLDKYRALVAEAIDKSGSCIICGFHPEMAAMWCDDYLKLKSLLENKHE